MMKIVYLCLYVILINGAYSEKVQQGQYPLQPNYSFANSIISTNNPIYLPREFHIPAPIFSTTNYHNLPFKPPPVQAANTSPTLFPKVFTSTVNYGEDNIAPQGERIDKRNISSATPSYFNQTNTQVYQEAERRQFRSFPQLSNYKQPIDRMDTKILSLSSASKDAANVLPVNQNTRGLIISADNSRSQELEQKASFHNIRYSPPPHMFIQSTTEPAIPILRLSNEMDLDGSFSYEALGADQTHYVQHSRMENIGTDNEGQIVEGSYSYVGDDGQTYTVHYIADSNGYRATGDHLPVAPPIPEIIQRSIQYNLAEEAKRPLNSQSFNEDEYDSNPNSSEKNSPNYYTSPRNLFTGRTPEAFSLGPPQNIISQNNLTPMASSKEPVKTNVQVSEDKIKRNNNYELLEPQITFLATQGAHIPSLNSVQKSPMPQLVNYESGVKELDQDNNKGLWRWQYGVNSKTDNAIPSKDSISRSSSEGDDIIIYFSDMTPEQYTKIMRSELSEDLQTNLNHNFNTQQQHEVNGVHINKEKYLNNYLNVSNVSSSLQEQINHNSNNNNIKSDFTSEKSVRLSENVYTGFDDSYKNYKPYVDNIVKHNEITQENNIYTRAPSTESTRWLNEKVHAQDLKTTTFTDQDNMYQTEFLNYDDTYHTSAPISHTQDWSTNNENSNTLKLSATENIYTSTIIPLEYNYIIQHIDKKEVKPQIKGENPKNYSMQSKFEQDLSTAETNIKEVVQQNIFLKHLLTPNVRQFHSEGSQRETQSESNLKTTTSILQKSLLNHHQSPRNESKSFNEWKTIEKKPLDMSDVLNYMVNKNVFESNRLRMKPRPLPFKQSTPLNSLNHKHEVKLDAIHDSKNKDSKNDFRVTNNNLRQDPQQLELRGIIKNYKILLRNNARHSNSEAETELSMSGLNNLSKPPLGRAGPSMKSYLPPIYS